MKCVFCFLIVLQSLAIGCGCHSADYGSPQPRQDTNKQHDSARPDTVTEWDNSSSLTYESHAPIKPKIGARQSSILIRSPKPGSSSFLNGRLVLSRKYSGLGSNDYVTVDIHCEPRMSGIRVQAVDGHGEEAVLHLLPDCVTSGQVLERPVGPHVVVVQIQEVTSMPDPSAEGMGMVGRIFSSIWIGVRVK